MSPHKTKPTSEHTSPVLQVEQLDIAFRRGASWTPVVNGLSFEVSRGETLAIVGESGSGKSVSAMSIMGLLPERSSRVGGSIRLRGRELLGLPDADLSAIRGNEIAMIFQEPMTSLNPVMRIGEQIAEPLYQHRGLSAAAAKAEALRLMERVRIPAAAQRYADYPHQFSGGMRQRVMIAMALACNPSVLIADEPTTALDVTIQAQILALIKELQKEEQMAVVFITHDMGVVAEVADRTLVMYRGDRVEAGATADIFAQPQQPYTRALLSAVPELGSMAGFAQPHPFPIYDMARGLSDTSSPLKDSVQSGPPWLLEVEGLSARFDVRSPLLRRVTGRVHAVENVSFQLQRGETLGIVGESGCGKSTTGRLVTGLLSATAGQIRIEGREVSQLSGLERARKIQMIFQDPYSSLDPRQSVGDALTEPLRVHGMAKKADCADIAARLLAKVGLPADAATRMPHEFSGGQRQRVCIARALAMQPGTIVADEAVSALDVSVKVQIVNLLLELQQEMGLGFLFISHDMAVVERISHRVAVMYMGEIVEIGSRADVFANPRHPYTRRLLEAVPIPDPRRRRERHMAPRELKTPYKPRDFVSPRRSYHQAGPGHLYMEADDDWS
ncbi:ABC transporter ATP-binding protein [Simplicispira suum]|uniref:Glutathione import ATP-binding protein GsiA n=1 Tax=Simplicispira suum TaxID=2109915 RepID=A0A2S0N2J2_9BURK|nr:ABC transporter ATP-binding protein [Simplicispira suum]AVO42369.1 glutathione ABC transporter ATP-binding protein GsiA [Simplicispira suum]